MLIWYEMLGRLNIDALPADPVTIGGAISIILGGIFVTAALFYFKRWKWLWTNWLTSLDHKKIGVMYLVVSALMLLRGVMDASMIRAQQALSVGYLQSSGGSYSVCNAVSHRGDR